MRSPKQLLLACAVLVGACAPPTDDNRPTPPSGPAAQRAPQPHDARPTAIHAGPARAELLDVRPAAYSPSEVDATVLARLPAAERASVATSPLPVLLPRSSGWAESARVVSRPAFYAASMTGAGADMGLHIAISASRVRHRYADMERDDGHTRSHIVRGHPAWVLANEGIWSVSFEERGVEYVVDVECAGALEDPRCQGPATVLSVAEDLVLVGGGLVLGEEVSQ
ncbi:MAG: hypothetical protein U0271_41445 [Polyangiaceae bacterium]